MTGKQKIAPRGAWQAVVALFAVFLLSACAVRSADENGITITHTARQPGAAQWTADRHCAKFGKRAVLVRKYPKQSNGIIPETNVSEFDCVP